MHFTRSKKKQIRQDIIWVKKYVEIESKNLMYRASVSEK